MLKATVRARKKSLCDSNYKRCKTLMAIYSNAIWCVYSGKQVACFGHRFWIILRTLAVLHVVLHGLQSKPLLLRQNDILKRTLRTVARRPDVFIKKRGGGETGPTARAQKLLSSAQTQEKYRSLP